MKNSHIIMHSENYADLNLRLVAATVNGFIFQIIDSLMQIILGAMFDLP